MASTENAQAKTTMCLAIVSAMAEENASLVRQMSDVEKIEAGRRIYHRGRLWGRDVVVVFSHWGKVAAASTVTLLITRFEATEIIFTGVAGAVDRSLNIGDIVVGTELYQHDMDVRPLIERHEIPLLAMTAMPSYVPRRALLASAAQHYLDLHLVEQLSAEVIGEFSLQAPKVVQGGIASGDQFISSEQCVEDIRGRLPGVVCVEMEGGAVAQVCTEFDIPFSVIRTISDSANDQAAMDFPKFIVEVAQMYSLGIMNVLLMDLPPLPNAD